jgi:hypothetical protein
MLNLEHSANTLVHVGEICPNTLSKLVHPVNGFLIKIGVSSFANCIFLILVLYLTSKDSSRVNSCKSKISESC